MDDLIWGGRDDFEVDKESIGNLETYIVAGGEVYAAVPGESFKDAVLKAADQAGYGKFRVFLNSVEIRPSMAPRTFTEGDKVEIRPYDQAG